MGSEKNTERQNSKELLTAHLQSPLAEIRLVLWEAHTHAPVGVGTSSEHLFYC